MRRKLPFVVLLLLVTIFLTGCVSGNPGTDTGGSKRFAVSGVVYNQSKYPTKAIVNLGGREMETKLDGVYHFEDVSPGTYSFAVTPLYYGEPSPYLEHHSSTISVTGDTVNDLRLDFVISDDLGEGYAYWTYNLVNGSGYYARISARLTGTEVYLAPGQTLRILLEPGVYTFMYSTGAGSREGKIWAYKPNTYGEITRERIYTK